MTEVQTTGEIESISHEECKVLLSQQHVGRLGVVLDGQPDIFPVNYGLDGDGIVFRTNAGAKLRGALSSPVVFEVDCLDFIRQQGWSVVVHGHAQDITRFTGPSLTEKAERAWAGPKDLLVRIAPTSMTGRRVWAHARLLA
jgi:hypothetical protein